MRKGLAQVKQTEFCQDWLNENPFASVHDEKIKRYTDGNSVIDLSMINPDIPPPRVLLDRLVEYVVKPAHHRYAVARGVRKLREAFAFKYERAFQVTLDAQDEVCVSMGSKDAILHSLRLFAPLGSKVLIGAPSYAAHVSACHLTGLEPVFFGLSRHEGLMLERIAAALKRHSPRVLLLNFPNNPTGIGVNTAFWQSLQELAAKARCLVINDFVYGELGHHGYEPASLLTACTSTKEGCLEVYSLSKAYSIPGWRIAALVGDARYVKDFAKLKSKVDYGVFLPLQLAAIQALIGESRDVEATRRIYTARAQVLVHGLEKLGCELTHPQAGACVWVPLPKQVLDACTQKTGSFADYLLQEEGIHVLPGSVFGEVYSPFIRLALVRPEAELQMVLDGIARVFENLRQQES